MTFFNVLAPLCVAVGNCTMVSAPEDGIEIWKAEVKIARYGVYERTFPEVFFAEIPGKIAWILGTVREDDPDMSNLLPFDSAMEQRDFLLMLREETIRSNESLGDMSRIFFGHEFSSEGKVMAAYLTSRGLSHDFGVSYVDDEGVIQRVSIPPGEEYGFIADDQSLEDFDRWFHDSILEKNNG